MKDCLLFASKYILAHPKTSAMGLAAIAGAVIGVVHNPALITDEKTYGAIITGIGLLLASDAK